MARRPSTSGRNFRWAGASSVAVVASAVVASAVTVAGSAVTVLASAWVGSAGRAGSRVVVLSLGRASGALGQPLGLRLQLTCPLYGAHHGMFPAYP